MPASVFRRGYFARYSPAPSLSLIFLKKNPFPAAVATHPASEIHMANVIKMESHCGEVPSRSHSAEDEQSASHSHHAKVEQMAVAAASFFQP